MLPLLLQAATAVPALMKYFGAGEKSTKIAEQVAEVAGMVAGNDIPPEERMKRILADAQLTREFQLRINDQMMAWDKMFLEDVQDARKRDSIFVQLGKQNWRAHAMFVLAVIVVVLLTLLIWESDNLSEYTKGIFTLVLGRFLGYLDNIYNFEFGTTRQSRDKDDTIKELSKS